MERRRFYSNPQCKKFDIFLKIIMFLLMGIALAMMNVDILFAIIAGLYTVFLPSS